jgi:hypothetical protein
MSCGKHTEHFRAWSTSLRGVTRRRLNEMGAMFPPKGFICDKCGTVNLRMNTLEEFYMPLSREDARPFLDVVD